MSSRSAPHGPTSPASDTLGSERPGRPLNPGGRGPLPDSTPPTGPPASTGDQISAPRHAADTTITGRHNRNSPALPGPNRLISILRKLGWQTHPAAWTVRYRDPDGRRARMIIRVDEQGVHITASRPGPVVLHPLQIGRLRAVLRQAAIAQSLLTESADNPLPHHTATPRIAR